MMNMIDNSNQHQHQHGGKRRSSTFSAFGNAIDCDQVLLPLGSLLDAPNATEEDNNKNFVKQSRRLSKKNLKDLVSNFWMPPANGTNGTTITTAQDNSNNNNNNNINNSNTLSVSLLSSSSNNLDNNNNINNLNNNKLMKIHSCSSTSSMNSRLRRMSSAQDAFGMFHPIEISTSCKNNNNNNNNKTNNGITANNTNMNMNINVRRTSNTESVRTSSTMNGDPNFPSVDILGGIDNHLFSSSSTNNNNNNNNTPLPNNIYTAIDDILSMQHQPVQTTSLSSSSSSSSSSSATTAPSSSSSIARVSLCNSSVHSDDTIATYCTTTASAIHSATAIVNSGYVNNYNHNCNSSNNNTADNVVMPTTITEPSPYDIVCGRNSGAFNYIGNRRFRVTIEMNLQRYIDSPTREDKTNVIKSIVWMLHEEIGARFLKKETVKKSSSSSSSSRMSSSTCSSSSSSSSSRSSRRGSSRFTVMTDKQAREKVGHALRDLVITARKEHQHQDKEQQPQHQQQQQQHQQQEKCC